MRVEARPAVDDERDPAQAAVLAERVDDLAARTVGQREVEHDERRFLAARENLQRLADAARQRDDEARPCRTVRTTSPTSGSSSTTSTCSWCGRRLTTS